ncbi:uncharacterized protein [Henckelia pumila]|uniref:uncharacterized protein isoform X3 n=1 Tax=Henckelia pumila TaxID=405737 RepID=UPI003C6DE4F6
MIGGIMLDLDRTSSVKVYRLSTVHIACFLYFVKSITHKFKCSFSMRDRVSNVLSFCLRKIPYLDHQDCFFFLVNWLLSLIHNRVICRKMLGGGRPNENTMIPCFTEENRVPNDINTLPHLQLFGHESGGQNSKIFRRTTFPRIQWRWHSSTHNLRALRSNSVVMVQAYRLLVAEMNVLEWDYPLHLGVTEAGEGNDGQMKSASGIGTLLMRKRLIPVED